MSAAALKYGGDYNPEQWSPETWREDITLMKRAGVNLVTVGVFSWSNLEPSPGEYQFGWMDEVLDLLHEAGIDVDLATPTASPPPWLCLDELEVLYVDDRGVRTHHGSRNHYCPSSPAYLKACRDIALQLGQRYGHHPSVVMWHIGNEYGPTCYCDHCAEAFRAWLGVRHGSIEQLNESWGTAFWSQRYRSFDEILPPRTAPYHFNPAHLLDYRRFASDALLAAHVDQRDVLRPLVNGSPITTNFMGFHPGLDQNRWAAELDVIADDHYIEPNDLKRGPARAAMTHDLMRSLSMKPWLMMEQSMGAVNWRPHNVPKTDSQRRADVLRAIGHGADGVLSFQWRQSRHGAERFHSAMLPHGGPDTSLHRSVVAIGSDLERLQAVRGKNQAAKVAMLFDWDSWWALTDPSVPTRLRDPIDVLLSWYQPLWQRGITTDIRSVESDLSSYDVVLAPITHLVSDAGLVNLRELVERGATLLLGPFTVVSNEHGGVRPGPFPAGMTDLLGAHVEQWWPLPAEGLKLSSDLLGDVSAHTWAEQLVVTNAEIIAKAADHTDLDAVIVRSKAHDFVLVGADLPEDGLDALIADVLKRRNIATTTLVTSAEGCEVIQRDPVTFIFNPTPQAATVELTGAATDLLTQTTHATTVTLPAGGALALTEES